MSASWCKVASNLDSHPKIRKAGAMGREVFLFALRRNAEPNNAATPGRVPKADLEPWYVADQLMRSEAEAADGLARCVKAKLLREEASFWAIVGWDENEWGREKSTERVRRWRDKQRDETLRNVSVTPVKRDETHETARSEEIRSEERRGDQKERERAPGGARVLALVPDKGKTKPKRLEPTYTEPELATVALVLSKLSDRNGCAYHRSKEHTSVIVSRLRAGFTAWDLRRVIAYCADELGWQDKPEMKPYLRPETLFGPKAMERYVYAARAWMPQDEPTENANDDRTMQGPRWEEPTWMTSTS